MTWKTCVFNGSLKNEAKIFEGQKFFKRYTNYFEFDLYNLDILKDKIIKIYWQMALLSITNPYNNNIIKKKDDSISHT